MGRVLITGASGFLGGHLCRSAAGRWKVLAGFHAHRTLEPGVCPVRVDLEDLRSLPRLLDDAQPDSVLLAAALQVDACEMSPERARVVNADATARVAEWCARRGRRMIYISSDMVFGGGEGSYREADEPVPLQIYGRSKLEAERRVAGICRDYCIVRLPLLYGFPAAGGACFFSRMIASFERGEAVRVFSDQFRSPGLVMNVADAILELLGSSCTGILHVAGSCRCSREEMARAACRLGGWPESLVRPVSTADVELAAPRPPDVSLDISVAQSVLTTRLLGMEEGMQLLLSHRSLGNPGESG